MSDTYEATALFLRQRVLILQARLAEAEALLRDIYSYAEDQGMETLMDMIDSADSADAAPKPGVCRHCGQYLDRRGKCRNPEHSP